MMNNTDMIVTKGGRILAEFKDPPGPEPAQGMFLKISDHEYFIQEVIVDYARNRLARTQVECRVD